MKGFFTRTEIRQGSRGQKKRDSLVALQYWHQIGLDGVKGMNPDAETPNMPPAGAERPDLYVLGEAPGREEDAQGVPFAGQAGDLLRSAIPEGMAKVVRWNNVVRTRPQKGRKPTVQEIECFRPSLQEDIEAARPKAILGVGLLPLQWVFGSAISKISVVRGRRFPIRVGEHRTWFFPIVHPEFLVRDRAMEQCFRDDVATAFAELDKLPKPVVADPAKAFDGVELIQSEDQLPSLFHFLKSEELVAFDIETTPLRPYAERARILSMAFAGAGRTLAVPLDHPRAKLAPSALGRVWEAIRAWLLGRTRKVAHNAAFELEWLGSKLKLRDLRLGLEDTMSQAFVMDERQGALSLDFLCRLHFGLPLKSLSGVRRDKHLDTEDLTKLLRYNGGDAKWTRELFLVQRDQKLRMSLQ